MNDLAFDSSQVDGLVEGLDDSGVAARGEERNVSPEMKTAQTGRDSPRRESVFDVVEGSVDEDTAVVPSSRFDPDGLVDGAGLGEGLVGDGDGLRRR